MCVRSFPLPLPLGACMLSRSPLSARARVFAIARSLPARSPPLSACRYPSSLARLHPRFRSSGVYTVRIGAYIEQMDAYRRKEIKPPHVPDVPTVDGSPAWDELFPEPEDGFPESDASDWDEAAGDGLFDEFNE